MVTTDDGTVSIDTARAVGGGGGTLALHEQVGDGVPISLVRLVRPKSLRRRTNGGLIETVAAATTAITAAATVDCEYDLP